MGLDVGWYTGLRRMGPEEQVAVGVVRFTIVPEFRAYAPEIEDGAPYVPTTQGRFRAGPYSFYSRFRERLAEIAGYPAAPPEAHYAGSHAASAWAMPREPRLPFYELINFSDCEGTLGAEACLRLAEDFRDFHEQAKAEPDWFHETFDHFGQAFFLAADAGAVEFF